MSAQDLHARVRALLDEHDPVRTDPREFLGARNRRAKGADIRSGARRHTDPLRLPRPRQLHSPFARAVVPVGLGLLFFAVLGGLLWIVAALLSDAKPSDNFATKTFRPGSASGWAQVVVEDGPILFPDLLGTDGDKTIVLDHQGTDPDLGWVIYLAHPADRPLSCKVTQVRHTPILAAAEWLANRDSRPRLNRVHAVLTVAAQRRSPNG